MTPEKAYCQTCKRDHYFGFDAVGGRLEFLSCQKGRKPMTPEGDAIKTPVSVSGTRFNTLLFHDADGQRIYPDVLVAAINEAAALREQVTNPMVCRLGCGLVDDACDAAGHPMRPLSEVLKENQALHEKVAELEQQNVKLIADLNSYSQMCGDIVTYGTTADVLDQHLKEAYDRIKQLEQTIRDLS